MISFVKTITEGYAYDADDYIPYDKVRVGNIVTDNEGESFEVLEKSGNGKLIVSLTDDPRDIRGMIYDKDCVAHASEQDMDDMYDEED